MGEFQGDDRGITDHETRTSDEVIRVDDADNDDDSY